MVGSPRAPEAASLKECDEVSITLSLKAHEIGTHYRIEYKEPHLGWDKSTHVITKPNDSECVLQDLNPTSTYEVRLFAINSAGQKSEASPVVAIDTLVPGCTPKPRCIIS